MSQHQRHKKSRTAPLIDAMGHGFTSFTMPSQMREQTISHPPENLRLSIRLLMNELNRVKWLVSDEELKKIDAVLDQANPDRTFRYIPQEGKP